MTHLPPSGEPSTVRGRAHPRRSAGPAAPAWAVIVALMSLYRAVRSSDARGKRPLAG
jgi:hypothetical protein